MTYLYLEDEMHEIISVRDKGVVFVSEVFGYVFVSDFDEFLISHISLILRKRVRSSRRINT